MPSKTAPSKKKKTTKKTKRFNLIQK